ncbi:hypothetical protein QBC32DRAFT_320121 [Pseudoneurospora amorphoporcata]|uniref:Uncharacterized protein n=1 Tax=Pseudoneurospora amorphoporcata TaxID=241081 RepID=A0AAN6NLZ0_9PEZI|nr:hypothetical protein QBC32DRAFT_320121 [Pseudoneurospora amorphoporcata]
MSFDDSDPALFSPSGSAGSGSGDLLDFVAPAISAFDLNSLRSAINKTFEVEFDIAVCRAALYEIPRDAALTDLLESLD